MYMVFDLNLKIYVELYFFIFIFYFPIHELNFPDHKYIQLSKENLMKTVQSIQLY